MCLVYPSSSLLNEGFRANAFVLMMYLRLQCFVKLFNQLQTRLSSLYRQSFDMLFHWRYRLMGADIALLAFVLKKSAKYTNASVSSLIPN